MSINYTDIQNFGETPNYNGNIGSITWKNSSDDIEKEYAYYYDNLNRLSAANYSQEDPIVSSILPTTDQFSTAYSYDRNGNIKTLTRNGFTGITYAQIDNLSYTYTDDGALSTIAENSNKENGFKSKTAGGTGAYTYDDNGNMLTDAHKGMTVTYNFLNLPTKVVKPEGTIEWHYDAAGTKLNKIVTTDHLAVNVNPILSKEYKASMTIESNGTVPTTNNTIFTAGQSVTLKEGFTATAGSDFLARILPNNVVQVREYWGGIEYFDSALEAIYFAEGRVKYDGASSEREYILSDYQGNNRVLFKDVGGIAEVVEDYAGFYPFGALHGQKSDYQNKYLFGNKELQTELDLGWSDFGVRCLDNWSGKWLGIDIMSEVKPSISPYAYGLGNPIRFSDPTGMIEEDGSVSTSLWGRDVTGGENSGEVLNSNFLSSGQLSRDLTNITGGDGQSFLITGKNRNKSSGETDWALEGVFQLAQYTSSLASGSRDAYNQLAGSGSSDSDWSSLPESKGDACVYPSVPEPGRLDCLHRPKDAYHHVPIAAASRDLLGFYFQRKCLSLQGTALRAQARTSPFHEADRMRGRFSPSAGVAIFLLPRHCW